MRVLMIAALFSVCAGLSAAAEGTKADWDRLAEPIVGTYARCVVAEIDRMLKTSATAEEVADAAMATCEPKLKPLRAVLIAEPFSDTQHGVEETMKQIADETRAAATADVHKQRKD